MKRKCFTLAFALSLVSQAAIAETITLGTGDSLPFAAVGAGDLPSGVLGDVSMSLLKDMGFEAKASPLPFARLYSSVHSGEIDGAVGVLRTENRATQALYSDPILTEYNILAVKKGAAFNFMALAELKDKRIGGRRGFAYPGLEAAGVSVEPANDDVNNIKKVIAGRLDAAIISSIAYLSQLDQSELRDEVELLPLAVGEVPIGIALADEKFSEGDIVSFNGKLAEFKSSEDYAAVLAKYGISDYVKTWPVAN
ncbi:substrate-binding periplasmic protein [Roseibium sp.]|uniref:substrate-binding periplasmic protein n=1 Tax=Roseibium sp. TaxID=1936156 RepID=UPI003D0FD065